MKFLNFADLLALHLLFSNAICRFLVAFLWMSRNQRPNVGCLRKLFLLTIGSAESKKNVRSLIERNILMFLDI